MKRFICSALAALFFIAVANTPIASAQNSAPVASPSPIASSAPQNISPVQIGQDVIDAYAQKERQISFLQAQFQQFATELYAPACKGDSVKSVQFPKWKGTQPHPYPAKVLCKNGHTYTVTGIISR